MRQGSRRSLITVAAASGALATLTGGTAAYADSGAQGGAAHSPGVASGNNVQVPVHVPVNVCGNTVDVVGLLNPAVGNRCSNGGHGKGHGGRPGGNAGGSGAQGGAHGSPGVGSGNNVQVPVDVPVNVCGNSVDVVGLLNPTHGNRCANEAPSRPEHPGGHGGDQPSAPGTHHPAPQHPAPHHPAPHHPAPDRPAPQPAEHSGTHPHAHAQPQLPHQQGPSHPEGRLAETGSGSTLGVVGPLGAGLLVGGYVLYRRARVMRG